MNPRVVNCRVTRHYDVYIGRGSKWGNPFRIGPDQGREAVIRMFRDYLESHPELKAAARTELRGKTLACFCAPRSCHGDILAELANA